MNNFLLKEKIPKIPGAHWMQQNFCSFTVGQNLLDSPDDVCCVSSSSISGSSSAPQPSRSAPTRPPAHHAALPDASSALSGRDSLCPQPCLHGPPSVGHSHSGVCSEPGRHHGPYRSQRRRTAGPCGSISVVLMWWEGPLSVNCTSPGFFFFFWFLHLLLFI